MPKSRTIDEAPVNSRSTFLDLMHLLAICPVTGRALTLAKRLLHVGPWAVRIFLVSSNRTGLKRSFEVQVSTTEGGLVLEVSGLPTWSPRKSTRSNFHGWGEMAMKSGVRVVKREDREAASNSLVVDDTTMVQRSTPESIVKSWITASRERRRNQAANCLQEIRRWDKNRIVALGQSAAMVVLSFLILMSGETEK